MIRILQFVAVAVSVALAGAQTRPVSNDPPSVSVRLSPLDAAKRAGTERCRSCHKAEAVAWALTGHAKLPAGAGECETCHEGGKAHADAEEAAAGDDAKSAAAAKLIFSFQGNPKENSRRCLECHQSSRGQKDFAHSAHLQHGVSCNDCHATHLVAAVREPKKIAAGFTQARIFSVPQLGERNRWVNGSLLKKSQPDLCYGCHLNIQAQFALPTHHRVPEGALKCTDCHNTHGTANRATLRRNSWESCAQCHIEKRGPFVFEHSAVKVEGCSACHTPHGSVNRQLLVRREERFLCLQCHVDPFAANVPHSRLSFQTRGDCTRCHSAIHGSNFDASFLH